MKISFCIIVHNEEENLPRCLKSIVSLADEIIVVDSDSTDRTCEVARKWGAQIFFHAWEGYVIQKNYALSLARNEWVFSIDADEELSPQLQKEILAFKKTESLEVNGFIMPRVVFFENRWIRFGDWYPDYLVRLFRRSHAKFTGGSVHERLEITGEILHFLGELHHYTYRDRADQMSRIERYSSLWAESAFKEGKRCGALAPYFRTGWRLFRGFVLKNGWKGGSLGWYIARACAREVFMKYSKLRRLQREAST